MEYGGPAVRVQGDIVAEREDRGGGKAYGVFEGKGCYGAWRRVWIGDWNGIWRPHGKPVDVCIRVLENVQTERSASARSVNEFKAHAAISHDIDRAGIQDIGGAPDICRGIPYVPDHVVHEACSAHVEAGG